MTGLLEPEVRKSKVKGQGHVVIKFATDVGIQVDMTASVSSCRLQCRRTYDQQWTGVIRQIHRELAAGPLECR